MGENRSKKNNTFLGMLFDNNPDCMLVYKLKTLQLVYANPIAVSNFGNLYQNKKPFSFFEEESRSTVRSMIELIRHSGNIDSFETSAVIQKKTGEKFQTDIIGKTIFLESDIYLLLLLPETGKVQISTSRQKQASVQQELTNKEDNFHRIAQELIEPVRAISTYIQLLEKNYGASLDTSGKQFVLFIQQGSQRLKHVIEGIHYYDQNIHSVAVSSETP